MRTHASAAVDAAVFAALGAASGAGLALVGGWALGMAPHGHALGASEYMRLLSSSILPEGLSHALDALGAPQGFDPATAREWIARYSPLTPWLAGCGAAGGGVLSGWAAWALGAPSSRPERGRQLLTGRPAVRAMRSEMRSEARWSGKGVQIHPRISISRDRETLGIIYVGSIGGGKTVSMKHLIRSIIERGDRALMYDNKGDYTSQISSIMPDPRQLGLIAPWDKRSMRWSVAGDIRSRAAARELASRLIPPPESGNTQWADGAAQILAGIIVWLARTTKGAWGWDDLLAAIAQPYKDFREAALSGYPMASKLLPAGEPNPTTGSYLANLASAAGGLISDLADSDSEAKQRGARTWNARDWMLGQTGPQVVIMQDSGEFQSLARALNSAIIRSCQGTITQMSESKSRRIWIVLDEFPQLGNIKGIDGLVDTGRSKGICTVLGFQTRAKVAHIFGADFADALLGNFGTQVICASKSAETRQWAAEQIGKAKVRRQTHSATRLAGAISPTNVSTSEQSSPEDVVWDTDLAALGRRGNGVDVIMVPGGNNVFKIRTPFPKGWRKTTKPNVPAAWTESLVVDEQNAGTARREPLVVAGQPAENWEENDQAWPDRNTQNTPPLSSTTSVQEQNLHVLPTPVAEGGAASKPASDEDELMGDEAAKLAADTLLPGTGIVSDAIEFADSLTEPSRTDEPAPQVQVTSCEQPHRKRRLVRRRAATQHDSQIED